LIQLYVNNSTYTKIMTTDTSSTKTRHPLLKRRHSSNALLRWSDFYKGKIWKCQTDSYLDGSKRLFLLKDLAVAFLLNIFNEYIRHSIVNGNGYHKAATYKILFGCLMITDVISRCFFNTIKLNKMITKKIMQMQSQLEIMDNHRKYYENQQITSILKYWHSWK
jgi:hypothetical protein